MKVLVTGANGFVGAEVCRQLLDKGYSVKGIVRRPEAITLLPQGVETGLIEDPYSSESWEDNLQGISSVIHLIAKTHSSDLRESKSYDSYYSTNVGITKTLLEACSSTNVSRFVYLSSIKAVGESSSDPLAEDSTSNPEDNYGRTKKGAEELVVRVCTGNDMQYIIVRPPMVYGPGVKGNFLRLLKLSKTNIPLPLASVNNKRSIIYVKNLADSLIYLLEHEKSGNSFFHVSDEPAVSTKELITEMRKNFGLHPRLFPLPPGLMGKTAALMGKGKEAEKVLGSLAVSSEKMRGTYSWEQPFSFEQGISQTCNWYNSIGG